MCVYLLLTYILILSAYRKLFASGAIRKMLLGFCRYQDRSLIRKHNVSTKWALPISLRVAERAPLQRGENDRIKMSG